MCTKNKITIGGEFEDLKENKLIWVHKNHRYDYKEIFYECNFFYNYLWLRYRIFESPYNQNIENNKPKSTKYNETLIQIVSSTKKVHLYYTT